MYVVPLKTLLRTALTTVFTDSYPDPRFQSLYTSLEYPDKQEHYPGILVDYADTRPLQIAGIDHVEYLASTTNGVTTYTQGTRWLYGGSASFTCYALSSLERDGLYDELVRVIAFSRENALLAPFRNYIESNEFIACEFDWDQIEAGGKGEAPGTDFGTDEIVYEITLSMDCFGEFVSDRTGALGALSAVVVDAYGPDDEDPDPDPNTNVHEATSPPAYNDDPTQWH